MKSLCIVLQLVQTSLPPSQVDAGVGHFFLGGCDGDADAARSESIGFLGRATYCVVHTMDHVIGWH